VKALVNKPELHERLQPYWDAFWCLDADRQVGMGGASRIPWTAMDRYAQRHELEGDDFLRLEYLLRRMDTAYLNHIKRKKPSSGNNK
jgi:hypothetical protein